MYEYEMTQQAFYDVWKEFNSPKELRGSKNAFKFLKRLHEVTEGLFIVDHFSYTNYDNVDKILLDGDYVGIYWKDYKGQKVDDMRRRVFGNVTYIYSLCNINKIKFIDFKGNLLILIMPIVASDTELKKHLKIKSLPKDKYQIEDNQDEFTTEYTFILDEEVHRCISHNLPFYSFLIQAKQYNIDCGYSRLFLLTATIEEVDDRLKRIHNKLNEWLDQDEFCELGNTLRRILEYLLKYYMCYINISLPSNSYGHNMIGQLSKGLKSEDQKLYELIDSSIIRIANELSHDSGKTVDYNDISTFYTKVSIIFEYMKIQFSKNK